jgi:dGTPase
VDVVLATKDHLEDEEESRLAPYALKSRVEGKRRSRPELSPLQYRTEYHRDRDRIIWSRSFKRLQNKTQIFPHYATDHFRRRLTHTLEVSQIATTIARALRLNEVATEAMALGHDLGHAPFGHAGERALDKVLKGYRDGLPRNCKIPSLNFNHAVQGVEVLERIEREYILSEEEGPYGLNLTHEVKEGVLKHRRFDQGSGSSGLTLSSIGEVIWHTDYKEFGPGPGSLEAQCVLLADKIAYFFADLEDALRSNILVLRTISDSLQRLVELISEQFDEEKEKYDPPKNLVDMDSFLDLRRKGIAAFILGAVKNSGNLLEKKKVQSVADGARERLVTLPRELQDAREVTYEELVVKRVFPHHLYQTTEQKAYNIVSQLFEAYTNNFDLVPHDYKTRTKKAYEGLVSSEEELRLLTVKNYIAGMTDSFAIAKHGDLFMSSREIALP